MKLIKSSVLFAVAAVLSSIHSVSGQAINAAVQMASPRVATTRSAAVAKPVARPAIAPQVAPRPAGLNSQRFNSTLPRVIPQPAINPQRSYSPTVRSSNPAFAALNVHTGTTGNLRRLETTRERRTFATNNETLATIDPQRHVRNRDPEAGPQPGKHELPKDNQGKKWHNKKDHAGFDEASRRHWHEWHDRNWWHDHCDAIVFVTTGYYFLDGSYWYPAYGYDPLQNYYDYDGPIYTYSNLLPDEVIANVQTALQDAGYYVGPITGSLSIDTRAALANFQRDYGLPITGAIDEATVETLGLYDAGGAYDSQTHEGY